MGDTIHARVKTKTATTAQWETVKNTFTPLKGEIVIYSDGNDGEPGIKVGDGTSKVGVLPIINKTVQADWTENNSSAPSYIKHKPEFANVAYTGSYDDLDDKPDADEIPYDELQHQTSTGANNVGDAIEYLDQAVAGADKVRYAIITMTDTENGTSNLSAQEIYTIDQQRRVWIFAFVLLGDKKVYAPLLYSVNDPIDGYVAVFAYEDQGTAGYNYARIVVINKSVKVTWKNAYVAAGDDISLLNNDTGFITGANVPSNETDPTVPSWAKQVSKPTYTAAEVGALPDTTVIPSATSDLVNDSGFIIGTDVPSNETDPTVYAWAKASSKPTYTASEVGALPDTTSVPDSLAIASNVISLKAGATVLSTITLPVYNGGVS